MIASVESVCSVFIIVNVIDCDLIWKRSDLNDAVVMIRESDEIPHILDCLKYWLSDGEFDDKAYEAVNLIEKSIYNDNKTMENQIEEIKKLLDKMTDVIENESLLNDYNIDKLIEYLKSQKNYISQNIM